jgi:hypothetical protein
MSREKKKQSNFEIEKKKIKLRNKKKSFNQKSKVYKG